MDDLSTEELAIRVDRSVPACLRLDWLGCSTRTEPGDALYPFFERVMVDASRGGCSVDMHFEAVKYLNSETFAAIFRVITFFGMARLALRIQYDPELKWQALGFETLQRTVQGLRGRDKPRVEFCRTRSGLDGASELSAFAGQAT